MNLQSYIGKLVKLTLTNNKILIGKVIDFDDKVDNFDGYNSIEIDTGRITYDISENKIKTIVLQNSILSTQIKRKRCYFCTL